MLKLHFNVSSIHIGKLVIKMLNEIFKGLIQIGNCKLTIPEKNILREILLWNGENKKNIKGKKS